MPVEMIASDLVPTTNCNHHQFSILFSPPDTFTVIRVSVKGLSGNP